MKKKPFLKYSVIVVFLLVSCNTDLHTKMWASKVLKNKPVVSIIDGYIECSYVENRGMVFGILNKTGFSRINNYLQYTTFMVAILLIIFLWINRKKSLSFLFPFITILAGALGNSIDRMKNGFVVDFIHIHLKDILNWPFFFNIADVFISAGLALLIIQMIFDNKHSLAKKKTQKNSFKQDTEHRRDT